MARDRVEVAAVGRHSPLADQGARRAGALAVRNRDARQWTDVRVTIRGFGIGASRGRPATGRYASRELRAIGPGELVSYDLGLFENSRGGTWNGGTMRVQDVELDFTRDGVRCRAAAMVSGAID